MLSREIFVNALAFTKRPILETIFELKNWLQVVPTAFQHFPELLRKTAVQSPPKLKKLTI
ncbi:hypothetical protein EGT49_09050 [Companilactobacillus suantsaicola]|uniref:Uncharacterized protein n=1 Tax=Companilactobacillus suantsaicola TaxID=2487723 RepID=A0A4Z0JJU2_9LACO|nr:hypothetical protein EGT49_09050 [Companilactobacillus suantsaicola]